MTKVWKIIARPTSKAGEIMLKEYYLVAMASEHAAIEYLRLRKEHLRNAQLESRGEASSDFVDWVGGLRDGQILCVITVT
jgi:hypothetical protein